MTVYSGHNGSLSVGGTEVGEVRSFSANLTVRDQDASVMGAGHTKNVAGQQTLEATVEVYHDHGDSGQTALTIGSEVAVILYPTGDTTAHTTISSTMRVMSRETSASHDGNASATYGLKSVSAISIGTVSA